MATNNDTRLGTVVICAALDVEYLALRAHLDGPFTEREERGTLYQIGTFPTDRGHWTVALTQTGAGNTQAGVELERAVSVFHPSMVLFVGVAGGRKDVALGDVVVADHVYDYETGKDTATDYLPRIKTAAPSHRLLGRARQLARDNAWQHRIRSTTSDTSPGAAGSDGVPKAVVKPIAAGGKVISDPSSATARFLDKHCGDAAAVEMEGHGFLHGAYVNDTVQALVVRGISDLLAGKTEAADEHWQPTASRHAAAFAFELLARHTAPPAPRAGAVPQQLPPAPRGFIGRTTQLAVLDHVQEQTAGIMAISAVGGTGGIGKTWLALTWAHRNRERFPDGRLFVDLHGYSPPPSQPAAPADVLHGFLEALGTDPGRVPDDLDRRMALYRTLTADKRMLIVLDNARDTEQVVPLLPGGDSCTVLVTSRHRLTALRTRHGAHPLPLDVLTDIEAHDLFSAALGTDRVTAEERAVTELIALCGGFPLALGLITARAAGQPHLPLAEAVAELRELGLDALDDTDDPTASLPIVLSWSLRWLTDQQRHTFGLLGIAPGPDTTPPAVAALTALPKASAHKTLSALEEASLVERRPGGRYAMHDLVRHWAADTAHTGLSDNVRETALVRVLDFHVHTANAANAVLDRHRAVLRLPPPAPGVQPSPLPDAAAGMAWLVAEHATLLACQRVAATLGRHNIAWNLAPVLHSFLFRRGYMRDALDVWQAALDAAAHLPELTFQIRTHKALGSVYARLGQHENGIEHLDRALDLAVRHSDPVEEASTHQSLAFLWEGRGDDRRAFDHARHALNLCRNLDQPVREADALNQVGWYAARLGDLDTARDHCQAALKLHRHHNDRGGEADALDSLGVIAYRSNDYRQAVNYYHQALNLHRTRDSAYDVADTLDNVGHPYVALGHRDQAREVWQEALELYREQGRDTDADRVQRQLDDLDNIVEADPDDIH